MAITSTRAKLRLELGDTDTDNELFQDDELDVWLTEETDDIQKARLRACEAAALKFARAYDFGTDGQQFKRSQMAQAYASMAKQLRVQCVTTSADASGIGQVGTTKADGYSDDVANNAVTGVMSSRLWPWRDGDVLP